MFKKIFQFLKLKWWDSRNPQPKRPFGITCFIGLPGTGKTLSLSEKLFRLKSEFPQAIIATNFGWKYQDYALTEWYQLISINNSEGKGVIFGIDEVHTIWSRYSSAKMPIEVLELFSQNRKWSKMLVCTAQSYSDVVIDIRRRCHFIIECRNIGARWVFQRAFAPDDYKEKDGEYTARRRAWRYSFIATNFIYDSYDTYSIIKSIAKIERKKVETPPPA